MVFYYMEVWKDIDGYEGNYQISSLGRVKRVEKHRKGRFGLYLLKERNCNLYTSEKGYFRVGLTLNSKEKKHYVHQLVAIAFLNHTPNGNTMVIDHIDANKKNNNIKNLQIITNRENKNRSVNPKYYVGVHKNRNMFVTKIQHNNKQIHLGSFKTPEEARDFYNMNVKRIEDNKPIIKKASF